MAKKNYHVSKSKKKSLKVVKPQKSKPKQLSVGQIVARQLKVDWKNIATDQQRIDILKECFNQTIKLTREVWRILTDKLNYHPAELDNPTRSHDLKLAHEKLHEAAYNIRCTETFLSDELEVYKGNVGDTERRIWEREKNRRRSEATQRVVAKRLAGKGVSRG